MQQTFAIPFTLGRMECLMATIATDYDAPSRKNSYYQHNHHASYELHYPTRGSFVLAIGRRGYHVPAGHVILIPPGVYHQVREASGDLEKMDLTFEISPPKSPQKYANEANILKTLQRSRRTFFDIDVSPGKHELRDTLEQIRSLARHYDEDPFLYRERLRARSTLLLLDIYAELNDAPVVSLPSDIPQAPNVIIDQFFSHNYDSASSSQELAQQLHVGVRQLNRILRQAYGMSYREKLNEVRLEVAMNFLTNSTKSIAEISELLGYLSPANFSTFIKSATGQTPSQIRKQHQSGGAAAPHAGGSGKDG